eukprot:TRINITY_DN1236_c2_g1_i2.p2 TRINITY_DN1236_c2_g1~~TRINITY_DN1236_c2_g1_i2.p2  ORF type:complete len:112 (+),score=15.41 TRINITY_DN1236_c2_g1_i2:542-877(+)
MHSNTSRIMELFMRMNILIKLLNKLAKLTLVPSKSVVTRMTEDALLLLLLFKADLYLLLLMPTNGLATEVEFSTVVELLLIMEFYLLVQLIVIGKLRIHGEPVGEKVDILD